MYELIPSKFFLEQVDSLNSKAKNMVFDKLMLVKIVCILDRSKDYKDLEKYLKNFN